MSRHFHIGEAAGDDCAQCKTMPPTVMDMGQGNRWKLLVSNPQLQTLARKAEELSGGKVCFAYATQPSATTYYVFDGPDRNVERMTRMQATEYLTMMIGRYSGAPDSDGDGTVESGAPQ